MSLDMFFLSQTTVPTVFHNANAQRSEDLDMSNVRHWLWRELLLGRSTHSTWALGMRSATQHRSKHSTSAVERPQMRDLSDWRVTPDATKILLFQREMWRCSVNGWPPSSAVNGTPAPKIETGVQSAGRALTLISTELSVTSIAPCHLACTQLIRNGRDALKIGDRQLSSCSHRHKSSQPIQLFLSTSRPMLETALITTAETRWRQGRRRQHQGRPTRDPNGSCFFAAGLPTDNVGSQNFLTFSNREISRLGDWWGELTTTTTPDTPA